MKALLIAMAAAVAASVSVPAHAITYFYVRCDSCPTAHTNPITQAAAVGGLSSGGAVVGDQVDICKNTQPGRSTWISYQATSAPVTSASQIVHVGTIGYIDMECLPE